MIKDNVYYIGVNDKDIDLFEGQFEVSNGMSYNSYLIIDEHIAIFDTVDKNFGDEWLDNISKALGDKKVDYLICSHMEPDHSANIKKFMDKYKNCKIVGTNLAFNMMKNLFLDDFIERRIVIKDNDELNLGLHTLKFITAPMVQWPEVMFTYDKTSKILFSADAFGKFGSLDYDDPEGWACEARRYYFGIVGKFGQNVEAVLKKVIQNDINVICPLHGPILDDNLSYYLEKYDTWSKYLPEDKGVCICYTSVYGHTKEAAQILEGELNKLNIKVSVFDLARDDMAEALEDAFRYDRLVLATTTYNGDIFPFMKTFINDLLDHNYQNRTIAFIENGMWAPMASKKMKEYLANLKNITYLENEVKILGNVSDDVKTQIKNMALELNK